MLELVFTLCVMLAIIWFVAACVDGIAANWHNGEE